MRLLAAIRRGLRKARVRLTPTALTVGECACRLGTTKGAVLKLIRAGALASGEVGEEPCVAVSAIERFEVQDPEQRSARRQGACA